MNVDQERQPYDLTNSRDREELISIISELIAGQSLVALIADTHFTQGDFGKIGYFSNFSREADGVALDVVDSDEGLLMYATCIARS